MEGHYQCTCIYSASNISTVYRFWYAWECYVYIYMPSLMDIQFIMQMLRIASYSLWIIRLIYSDYDNGHLVWMQPSFFTCIQKAIINDVLQLLCTVALDLCYIAFNDYLLTSIAWGPTSSTLLRGGRLLAVSHCRGDRSKSNHWILRQLNPPP